MYELTISTHFDAAHSLIDYPGACARLHGHTFGVDVVIAGMALNEIGLLYDFKELKDNVRAILDRYDHRHMNEVVPFDTISPTAENVANFLYHELKKSSLPTGIKVKKVTIWESPKAGVSYYE